MRGSMLPIRAIGLSCRWDPCPALRLRARAAPSRRVVSLAANPDREPYSWIIPQRVAVDGSNSTIMVGYYGGSADFGGTTFFSAGYSAGYVAAFSSAGSHLWSKSFDGADVRGVAATDSSGNVVITG